MKTNVADGRKTHSRLIDVRAVIYKQVSENLRKTIILSYAAG